MAFEQFAVKITVLKKLFHKEIFEQLHPHNPERWEHCRHFEQGQEFFASKESPWEMPAGFCGWAWADIQKLVYGMARGGNDVFVTCCTDGFRPVLFKLEKVTNE